MPISGKDVRVAIFDTGIGGTRRGFRHIMDVVDFTNEGTVNDGKMCIYV